MPISANSGQLSDSISRPLEERELRLEAQDHASGSFVGDRTDHDVCARRVDIAKLALKGALRENGGRRQRGVQPVDGVDAGRRGVARRESYACPQQRIFDYFEALGEGDSWEVAFRQTFGRDINTFYREYDAVDGR